MVRLDLRRNSWRHHLGSPMGAGSVDAHCNFEGAADELLCRCHYRIDCCVWERKVTLGRRLIEHAARGHTQDEAEEATGC
jgi:hypothetical protein